MGMLGTGTLTARGVLSTGMPNAQGHTQYRDAHCPWGDSVPGCSVWGRPLPGGMLGPGTLGPGMLGPELPAARGMLGTGMLNMGMLGTGMPGMGMPGTGMLSPGTPCPAAGDRAGERYSRRHWRLFLPPPQMKSPQRSHQVWSPRRRGSKRCPVPGAAASRGSGRAAGPCLRAGLMRSALARSKRPRPGRGSGCSSRSSISSMAPGAARHRRGN